jgi:hypothetical protein
MDTSWRYNFIRSDGVDYIEPQNIPHTRHFKPLQGSSPWCQRQYTMSMLAGNKDYHIWNHNNHFIMVYDWKIWRSCSALQTRGYTMQCRVSVDKRKLRITMDLEGESRDIFEIHQHSGNSAEVWTTASGIKAYMVTSTLHCLLITLNLRCTCPRNIIADWLILPFSFRVRRWVLGLVVGYPVLRLPQFSSASPTKYLDAGHDLFYVLRNSALKTIFQFDPL